MVSFFKAVALTSLSAASGWLLGTAAIKGSSYKGAVANPASGKGSAKMAQSISPVRNISSNLTVKFSSNISGISGDF